MLRYLGPSLVILLLIGFSIPSQASGILPTVSSSAAYGPHSATTSHAFTVSAGTAPDLVILCVEFNTATGTITYPSGWSIAGTTLVNTITGVCIYEYVSDGSSVTATFTTGSSAADAAVSYRVVGAGGKMTIDPTGASGSSSSPQPPAITVSPTDAVLIVDAMLFGNTNFCTVSTYATGFTSNKISATSGSISAGAAMSTKSETIGTETPGTATLSASCLWVAFSFAVGGTSLSVSISANPNYGAATLAVTFTSTILGGTGPLTYSWAFGDGSTSTSASPTHSYTASGKYLAQVTVTDSSAPPQIATASQTINVGGTDFQVVNSWPGLVLSGTINTVISGTLTLGGTVNVILSGTINAVISGTLALTGIPATIDSFANFPVVFVLLSMIAIVLLIAGIRMNMGLVLLSGLVTLMAAFSGFNYTGNLFIGGTLAVLGIMIILWTIGEIIDARKEGQT